MDTNFFFLFECSEKAESYPMSTDSLPIDHGKYKRDGGNSLMGLGSLISLGNSFSDLSGLGNELVISFHKRIQHTQWRLTFFFGVQRKRPSLPNPDGQFHGPPLQ
jgi:hypothetical protein